MAQSQRDFSLVVGHQKKSAPSWIFLRNGLVLLPIGSVPGTGHAILSLETIINIRGFYVVIASLQGNVLCRENATSR